MESPTGSMLKMFVSSCSNRIEKQLNMRHGSWYWISHQDGIQSILAKRGSTAHLIHLNSRYIQPILIHDKIRHVVYILTGCGFWIRTTTPQGTKIVNPTIGVRRSRQLQGIGMVLDPTTERSSTRTRYMQTHVFVRY